MKLLYVFILILLVTTPSLYAQSIRTEVYVGLSSSTLSFVTEDGDFPEQWGDIFSSKPGLTLGVRFSRTLTEYVTLESALGLNAKGYSYALRADDDWWCGGTCIEGRSDLNAYYLEIPLILKVALPTKDKVFHVFGGPVAGVGLFGSYSSNGTEWEKPFFLEYLSPSIQRGVEKGNIRWGSGRESLPRLNYGYEIGISIELDFISVRVAYQQGLSNIVRNNNPGSDGGDATSRHNQTYVTVGYRFGR